MSGPGERLAVAMSGGVDSSVAAALLLRKGCDPFGVTLRLWPCEGDEDWRACCGVDGIEQARAAAGRIGIPHYVVDCRDEFEKRVLEPAWSEYARGRTPNPCVLCNEHIKFGLLFDHARRLGATGLATGHHARVRRDQGQGKALLLRGADRDKDQSYFLFSLREEQIDVTVMPVGEMTKVEVRDLARELGLPNAERPESQDACFLVEESGFAESLRRKFGAPARPGAIVDTDGHAIGGHQGVHAFTIGQRRGLGVALGRRAYVLAIDAERGEVVVGSDESELLADGFDALDVRWLAGYGTQGPVKCDVQIRYRHRPVPAAVETSGDGPSRVRVLFDKPQRAVTPGQAAVFYDGDHVIGGGWIDRAM